MKNKAVCLMTVLCMALCLFSSLGVPAKADNLSSGLVAAYGRASADAFLSCKGVHIQSVPTSVHGIVSCNTLDVDFDGAPELIVTRIEDGQSGAQAVAEIYEENGSVGSPKFSAKICGLEYCAQINDTIFYNPYLGCYCIFDDETNVGAYTGYYSCSAALYSITSAGIKTVGTWSYCTVEQSKNPSKDIEQMKAQGVTNIQNYDNCNNANGVKSTKDSIQLIKVDASTTGGFSVYEIDHYQRVSGENDKSMTAPRVPAVMLDGTRVIFGQQPVIRSSRTMVPIRAVFEAMGASVTWNNSTKTAVAVKDGNTVSITIGKNYLLKNGSRMALDAPACLINGSTYIPLRATAEAMNYKVTWDSQTYTASIYS